MVAAELERRGACRDRDDEQFKEYLAEMPWWSYDRARPENETLAARCRVESIPTLALVSASGDLITSQAADLLRADPTGKDFPYLPRPIETLTAISAPTVNSERCMIAFVDGSSATAVPDAHSVLKDVATESFGKTGASRSAHFFVADCQDEFVQRVMQVRSRPRLALCSRAGALHAFICRNCSCVRAECVW